MGYGFSGREIELMEKCTSCFFFGLGRQAVRRYFDGNLRDFAGLFKGNDRNREQADGGCFGKNPETWDKVKKKIEDKWIELKIYVCQQMNISLSEVENLESRKFYKYYEKLKEYGNKDNRSRRNY